jgi:hypothetical protein
MVTIYSASAWACKNCVDRGAGKVKHPEDTLLNAFTWQLGLLSRNQNRQCRVYFVESTLEQPL